MDLPLRLDVQCNAGIAAKKEVFKIKSSGCLVPADQDRDREVFGKIGRGWS
ncbi:hypothetical protein SERLA73DRAFT_129683, partial [Serpula lacrymans var. lacrymans S7.3]